MPSLKDIRSRIDTTKNTQQITKAMKLVSAAKLRKAQLQIVGMRPYANALMKIIGNIVMTQRVSHPLMVQPTETKRVLLIVLSSDRGLAGGFNANVNKFTDNYIRTNKSKYEKLDVMFIGKRAMDFFGRKGISNPDSMTRLDKDISYTLAAKVAHKAMKHFLEGEYDEVRLIYNEFKSAISQTITTETLLPVDLKKAGVAIDSAQTTGFSNDMIFEPEPEVMIQEMLEKHFTVQVYRTMAESVAAEHGARMTAMENATNNAKEVLSKLTLTYNKARQEKITTELIEIVSGAEALK